MKFVFNKDIERASVRLQRLGPLIKYRNKRHWPLQELAQQASDTRCNTQHIVELIWTQAHKATKD